MADYDSTIQSPRFYAGERLGGRYTVVDLIGEGAVGEVYSAWDEEAARPVALKTLRAAVASHPAIVERFRREIQLAGMAPHLNVCRTFHLGTHPLSDGTELIFLTMELLRGLTLARYLRHRGRLATDEALPLVVQITAGLQAVHAAGIIYRDLKPENLMLVPDTDGSLPFPVRVVITDFGLARRLEAAGESITTLGQALGTPLYMAPEQVISGVEPLTPATDIYALGAVLYELVTNEPPFEGSATAVMKLKCHKPRPPSPRRIVPTLDPRWESAIMRCLERLPDHRFQTAVEVEAALTGVTLH